MDFAKILELITKAESAASALLAAGKDIAPAWQAVKDLFKSGDAITQADYDAADATLDALLDQFNADLPPA